MKEKHSYYAIILVFLLCFIGNIVVGEDMASAFNYKYKGVTFKCSENSGNTVTITGWKERGAKSVVVPAQTMDRKGKIYTVTDVGNYISGSSCSVEELYLEEGIKEINKRAFYEYHKLKKVFLPSTIKRIGKGAFGNMDKVDTIYVPTEKYDSIALSLIESGMRSWIGKTSVKYIHEEDMLPGDREPEEDESVHVESPVATETTVPVVSGIPTLKVVSFKKVSSSIAARTDQRIDYNQNLCALVKVSIAKYQASYGGDYIPEPVMNYVAFNRKGRDYVWLAEGATEMEIYSENKEFEPLVVNFSDESKKKVKKLESGSVYELLLRITYVY